MNLVLLFESDRLATEGGGLPRFELRGERTAHIRSVLGLGLGARLRVGLMGAAHGVATIVEVSHDRLIIEVEFDEEPEARIPTDLLLAIPRPKSLQKLLPEVAALGVDRLVLFRSWRVDKAYLEVQLLEPERYGPLLHAGLMQARSTQPPVVEVARLFKPFVEDELPAMMRPTTRAFIAHPGAELRLADQRIGEHEHVVLAVGPEGGFIPYELDAFKERGFLPVSMGPRSLRVETACVALLAQIALLRQRS